MQSGKKYKQGKGETENVNRNKALRILKADQGLRGLRLSGEEGPKPKKQTKKFHKIFRIKKFPLDGS